MPSIRVYLAQYNNKSTIVIVGNKIIDAYTILYFMILQLHGDDPDIMLNVKSDSRAGADTSDIKSINQSYLIRRVMNIHIVIDSSVDRGFPLAKVTLEMNVLVMRMANEKSSEGCLLGNLITRMK